MMKLVEGRAGALGGEKGPEDVLLRTTLAS